MNDSLRPALLLLASCAACAADTSGIAPAHAEASFPVHYEMRSAFAEMPTFDTQLATTEADASATRLRVTAHLAWVDDRLADRVFKSSDSGLMAQALLPEEAQRLIGALSDEELPEAVVRLGERAWLSDFEEKTYLVGCDVDVNGGEVNKKSVVRAAAGGASVELVARAASPSGIDVDVAFDLLVPNIAFAGTDSPDRVVMCLDVPVIVGQRVRTQATIASGGTLVVGGFRLMAPLRLRGSEWVSQSLSTTLLAFVTVEPTASAQTAR